MNKNESVSNEEDQEELKEILRAKILGDLRRLDSAKNFNAKEINELYEILARIHNEPIIEEKPMTRDEVRNRTFVSYCKTNNKFLTFFDSIKFDIK